MPRATTKRTTKKPARRRSASTPIGLITMMQALRLDGDTNRAARRHAAAVFPLAQQVLENLEDWDGSDRGELRIVDEAVQRLFPGIEDPVDAHTNAEAGFYVGAATAWLLMSRLQGGAR